MKDLKEIKRIENDMYILVWNELKTTTTCKNYGWSKCIKITKYGKSEFFGNAFIKTEFAYTNHDLSSFHVYKSKYEKVNWKQDEN